MEEKGLKKATEQQSHAAKSPTRDESDVTSETDSADVARDAEGEPVLTQVSRRAMATDFVVMLPHHAADAVELVVEALDGLDAIESALTVYRDDSEVSRANRCAFSEPVRLSAQTFALLQSAIGWSQRTDGAFDVTAGPLVEAWGFTQRSGRKPTSDEIDAARRLVGYQHLQLSEEQQTVRFAKPGMSINLGAIGKGDALDRLTEQLRGRGLNDFLIHGGNSSVIAAGDQVSGSGLGWGVGLAHPTKPKRRLAGVWLRNTALATSGSGKQFFHHRGRRYGHVIDPRTGYPAGDLLSLTVLTPSARDADACATGLFVAGSEAIDQLAQKDWMPPVITVRQASRQDAVEIQWSGDVRWVDAPSSEDSPPLQSDD
jgi:thiamine biosynthesis lipoprotein